MKTNNGQTQKQKTKARQKESWRTLWVVYIGGAMAQTFEVAKCNRLELRKWIPEMPALSSIEKLDEVL